MADAHHAAAQRLGLVDVAGAELTSSLAGLTITVSPTAVPVAVATRGAGFCTSFEFNRLCASLDEAVVQSYCTVHQYYRVFMHLIAYKLFLASEEQGEPRSFDLDVPVLIDEPIRQVLKPVAEVPLATHNMLSAIGKVEGQNV